MVRLVLPALALIAVTPAFADIGNQDRSDHVRVKKPAKIVMLSFYADWCAPCRFLATKTLTDEKVRRLLEERVTVVRINIDKDRKLTEKHRVLAIPTLIFLDPAGKEMGRIMGSVPPATFLDQAGKILK